MRSRPIAPRNSSGTKRSWSTRVPPELTRAFMMKFWPKQWKSGSAQRPRSSGVIREGGERNRSLARRADIDQGAGGWQVTPGRKVPRHGVRGDDGGDLPVPADVRDLIRLVGDVERQGDQAALLGGVVRQDELGPVRDVQPDALPRLEAEPLQTRGQRRGVPVQLPVGPAPVLEGERRAIREVEGRPLEHLGDVHRPPLTLPLPPGGEEKRNTGIIRV